MKAARKTTARRKVTRRAPPLSLSARIERLEKAVLWPAPVAAAKTPIARFTKLDAGGKPTTGEHVAVHDSKTGLTWTAGPVQDGKEFNHADALKACAAVDLFGQVDWRAPTIEELLSIVDYTRVDPAVDTGYFKGPYSWTWSSTVAAAPSGFAWGVVLYGGGSFRGGRAVRYRVRAVRAGES